MVCQGQTLSPSTNKSQSQKRSVCDIHAIVYNSTKFTLDWTALKEITNFSVTFQNAAQAQIAVQNKLEHSIPVIIKQSLKDVPRKGQWSVCSVVTAGRPSDCPGTDHCTTDSHSAPTKKTLNSLTGKNGCTCARAPMLQHISSCHTVKPVWKDFTLTQLVGCLFFLCFGFLLLEYRGPQKESLRLVLLLECHSQIEPFGQQHWQRKKIIQKNSGNFRILAVTCYHDKAASALSPTSIKIMLDYWMHTQQCNIQILFKLYLSWNPILSSRLDVFYFTKIIAGSGCSLTITLPSCPPIVISMSSARLFPSDSTKNLARVRSLAGFTLHDLLSWSSSQQWKTVLCT